VSTATLVPPQLSCHPAGYAALPLAGVRWLEPAGVDLYACEGAAARPNLLCGRSLELSQERMHHLAEEGVNHLFVRGSDFERVSRLLRAELGQILACGEISPEEQIALLQMAAAVDIESTFRLIKCDRYVSHARQYGKLIAWLACSHDIVAHRLFELMRHDERKFSRVTNVAAYCALLAKNLGIRDEKELEQITIGAMLYDIGERLIPEEFLDKNEPLSTHEREIVEQHPRVGFMNLLEFDFLTTAQRLMAYQHHERINGRGYPVHLTGNEIHPWAKIVAVVDVFDAATGPRPYRPALEVSEALDYLLKNAGTLYDEETVACWIMAMTR
jgi:HD-GYP domain-containing protein (c-di-GMP phosphodiesterase class II)